MRIILSEYVPHCLAPLHLATSQITCEYHLEGWCWKLYELNAIKVWPSENRERGSMLLVSFFSQIGVSLMGPRYTFCLGRYACSPLLSSPPEQIRRLYFVIYNLNQQYLLNNRLVCETFYIFGLQASRTLELDQLCRHFKRI